MHRWLMKPWNASRRYSFWNMKDQSNLQEWPYSFDMNRMAISIVKSASTSHLAQRLWHKPWMQIHARGHHRLI